MLGFFVVKPGTAIAADVDVSARESATLRGDQT